ncbi:hypothetical protein BRD00_02760 [Halobacteriales archaeon QS_8_69_26]|nr:MAG: hypothetical protein BRD00_02760 [Halobacteriales archaeon QS_8_69_26]
MTPTVTSPERLEDAVGKLDVRIDEQQHRLSAGVVPDERIPSAVYGLANAHDVLARCHALLGDADAAREAYAEAAVYYLSAVGESKKRRSTLRPRERHDDPRTCIHAIERAVLADRFDLAECIATETVLMGQPFLVEHDNRSYYAAKLFAAVVLEDDDWSRYAREYRTAIGDRPDPPDEFRLFVYEGIAEGDIDELARGLEGMLEHSGRFTEEDDVPGETVEDWVAALCLLAGEKGLDVTVEDPSVPDVLLPEAGSGTRVIRRSDPDEDLPDVEEDPVTGDYVFAEEVAYPADGPLTAEDLPETEDGRVLSDDWVKGVIARYRDHGDEEYAALADQLEEARREGEIHRRLVVRPGEDGRTDFRVDRSVYDLGVDDAEFHTD